MSRESKNSRVKNQRYFNWFSDPIFSGWLCKESDKTKTRCSICHKTIELSSSGRLTLTDHAKGKRHQDVLTKKTNFFKPRAKTSNSVAEEPASNCSDGQQRLDDIFAGTDSVKAEIIWTLKSVMSGYSIRSNDNLSETFSTMFPEFKSVKPFNVARTKSMYVINHGLAPYFKSLLKADIDKSDMLSFSFDESWNEVTQNLR